MRVCIMGASGKLDSYKGRITVIPGRGSDLEEGESQGLPVWSRHVGDPILQSNITRRVDFALFMVEALRNDELVHEAPAIVGRQRRKPHKDSCCAPHRPDHRGRIRS
jgi:hypothetical protein